MHHKIVRVYPQFLYIPSFDSSSFEPFCWRKLILYKYFHSIPRDIGTTASEIISHWKQIKGTYTIWHVERAQEEPCTPLSNDSNSDAINFPLSNNMDEWELLSQMRPGNNSQIDDLEMLGHRDFDKLHDWTHNNITN